MSHSQNENYTSNDGSTQEVTSSDVGPEATETGTACEAVGQLYLWSTLTTNQHARLPSITSQGQTGFIKGRQGFFVWNIVHASLSQAEIILCLDAQKAFHQVEWDYLHYRLSKCRFGECFLSSVKLLYSSPLASLQTNKDKSPCFVLFSLCFIYPAGTTSHR